MTISPITPNELVTKVEDVETKVENTSICGNGAPTTETEGTVGLLYQDTENGKLYICTAADTSTPSYTWEKISDALVNTATGTRSLTIAGVIATAGDATDIGIGASATAYATAVGRNAKANGTAALALGRSTTASATNAIALGTSASATAIGAIALGPQAKNSEAKTFKVALTDKNDSTPAIDESTGLFTLLKSDGKIPAGRLPISSSVSSSSTNETTVGAKLFYDTIGDLETLLHNINSGS